MKDILRPYIPEYKKEVTKSGERILGTNEYANLTLYSGLLESFEVGALFPRSSWLILPSFSNASQEYAISKSSQAKGIVL